MSEPRDGDADRPVDLSKTPSGDEPLDFDPYRFGLPDHPVPPEFAPPGYVPPEPTVSFDAPYSPYGPSSPYGRSPQGPAPYGQPPYAGGQPPYLGGPPPGGYPGYPGPGGYGPGYGSQPPGQVGPNHNNGKATWSLVCGIGSILFCWLTFLNLALIVPAVVLGFMVTSDKRSASRGMAIAGLICAAVGTVVTIALSVWVIHLTHECGDVHGDQLRQGIQQKI